LAISPWWQLPFNDDGRLRHANSEEADTDGDDDFDPTTPRVDDAIAGWYLDQLARILPLDDAHSSGKHPKVAATAKRVIDAWQHGEKVVVFCHYIRTGQVLRQVISGLMMDEILRRSSEKLRCSRAKAEQCGQPIRVYLPYLGETQDEKQYRVVMDRERWFKVVRGEKLKVDARTTEKLATRVPLPASIAEGLAFRLAVP
jgi:hypothetical protein